MENKNNIIYLIVGFFIIPSLFYSCSTRKDTLTRKLFMQNRKVSIELPPREEILSGDGGGTVVALGEQTEFVNEDNRSEVIQAAADSVARQRSVNEMQFIKDVVVTAHYVQQFTPERDGYVNIDFIIRVPKEIVSNDWRVSLQPWLMLSDSTVALESIILKGEHFLKRQESDIAAYEAFLASIVDTEDYDRVFLNHAGIARDLQRRQNFYYLMYQKHFNMVDKYHNWKQMMEERYSYANTLKDARREKLYHNLMLKGEEKQARAWAVRKDTTGIVAKYQRRYERKVNRWPQYKIERELSYSMVPRKYRGFYIEDIRLNDLKNEHMSVEDSIQIAQHHYLFDAIAENERKAQLRDQIRRNMVPYPMEDDVRFMAIGERDNDFIFYYTQPWAVTPGLDKIKVTMQGVVDAIDMSKYELPKTDTLTYLISSLAELADTTLTVKRTKVNRNLIARETIYPKFAANRTEFNINFGDNRKQVDELQALYNRYTKERGLNLDSLRITSTTALDGSYNNNIRLSRGRVEAFSKYISDKHSPSFPEYKIRTYFGGEDWKTMIELIEKRNDLENKTAILSALKRGKAFPDETEQDIKRLYRADYKIIQESVYPMLSKMDLIFFLSRPGIIGTDTVYIEPKENYIEGLELLMGRRYEEALAILGPHADYNTALCLTALGYHGKAYDILAKEEVNGNTAYLLAIVCSRLHKTLEAKDHLLKALELDPEKALRAVIDTETAALIRSYSLQEEIRDAEWRWLYDGIPGAMKPGTKPTSTAVGTSPADDSSPSQPE